VSADGYYFADADGNRIEVSEWGELTADLPGRTVGETDVRMPNNLLVKVRTLWHGIIEPASCCYQLFGTAVAYDPKPDGEMKFLHVKGYADKAAAEKGHADTVTMLRAGKPVTHLHEGGPAR
jgi:hypothetical protein